MPDCPVACSITGTKEDGMSSLPVAAGADPIPTLSLQSSYSQSGLIEDHFGERQWLEDYSGEKWHFARAILGEITK